MLSSVLQKPIKILPFAISLLLLSGFRVAPDARQLLDWSNQTLTRIYDPSGQKLKKWELNITDDFFLRLRRTYTNGKQEYFSFQLHNFDDLDYNGTADKGTLSISTKADNIIVQTYNDRKGNIDSMATSLNIPVKDIEPEQIDSLRNALLSFKDEVRL